MLTWSARFIAALAAASMTGLVGYGGSGGRVPAPWLGTVRILPSPAGSGSAQPQLQTTAHGTMMSWVERHGATAVLKFAEYRQARWTAARTVASGDDWFVNWADVPSVVRLDNRSVAAHWLQKSAATPYAYDVRLTHSRDDGRSWAAAVTPHHDGTLTEHGFATLFPMPGLGLGIVWLDGRLLKDSAGHDGSHGSPAGSMTLRFGAFDAGWRQVADEPIDGRVCDCCPTTVAMTSEGPVVAFRNRTDDEVRDIHVSRFEHGRWTEPVAAHEDRWKIAACPVNGPMLSARGREVALAWFTAASGQGRAFVAFSSDAGRTFGRPVRLDEAASLGRVDVEILPDGAAVASWIELGDVGASFMIRRVDASGRTSRAVRVTKLEGSRSTGYPRLAVQGNDLVFAWTDAASRTVRTAVATLAD